MNKAAYEKLPEDLQAIVFQASRVANHNMQLEYIARNNEALESLVNEHGVVLKRLPDKVLDKLRELADEVVTEIAAKDAFSQRTYDSFLKFKRQVMAWQEISLRSYLNVRA